MRIQPGASSIQLLQAQQAFRARTVMPESPVQEETPTPTVEQIRPELSFPPVNPQWQDAVNEIQNIAQQAGFLGVSEQDIQRAYTYGESLLVDYQV